MNESPSTERKAWEAPELTDLSVSDDTLQPTKPGNTGEYAEGISFGPS